MIECYLTQQKRRGNFQSFLSAFYRNNITSVSKQEYGLSIPPVIRTCHVIYERKDKDAIVFRFADVVMCLIVHVCSFYCL